MTAAVLRLVSEVPVVCVLIGCAFGIGMAGPLTVGAIFSPAPLQPIRDLAEGTERVAAGEYGQRLPVVQDDDLGALAASFNRLQAGLVERQRLQAAFGTYVDPALAARLLEQDDDVFTGERREVTVMFVDVRDIGINTGVVIAGTICGGGKLEFTLIGDAVNVAARVEQLTKTIGDTCSPGSASTPWRIFPADSSTGDSMS